MKLNFTVFYRERQAHVR